MLRSIRHLHAPPSASCSLRRLHVAVSAPSSLSDFAIDSRCPLGVGAHSTVYWAQHRESDKIVALKAMTPHVQCEATKDILTGCIAKETLVFDKLLGSGESHPHVVDPVAQFVRPGSEAHDIGLLLPQEAVENSVHFFVAEFLGGGSLADRMKYRQATGSRFEPQEVLDVAVAVSQGLAFLHVQGIAHRDVKPENLIYSNGTPRELKLIDFSLAAVARADQMEGAFHGEVGTEGYVAPEVLMQGKGAQGYGPKCDIFSLGCVLHAMLAGNAPTVELSSSGPFAARVNSSLPAGVSSKTRRFLNSLLAVRPEDRPEALEIIDICKSVSISEKVRSV